MRDSMLVRYTTARAVSQQHLSWHKQQQLSSCESIMLRGRNQHQPPAHCGYLQSTPGLPHINLLLFLPAHV
jgi:hypothetical protein